MSSKVLEDPVLRAMETKFKQGTAPTIKWMVI